MATMKDVANACGVSVSLVSKAINGYQDIHPDTKQKILDSIKELGYVPNSNASALSRKNQNKIGIIIRGYKGSGNDTFIDEISMIYATATFKQALQKNIDVLILFDDIIIGKSEVEISNLLKAHNITGLILFGLNKNESELYSLFENDDFKKVVIDVPVTNVHTSSVSIEDAKAQISLMENCIAPTLSQILYIAGPKDDVTAGQRLLGAKYYSRINNINMDVVHCNYETNQAYRSIKSNATIQKYEAIVCANDMMAIGAARALEELDLDTLVTGFDAINLLSYIDTRIPTIDQNFHAKANMAVDELIRLFDGEEARSIFDTYTYIDDIRDINSVFK